MEINLATMPDRPYITLSFIRDFNRTRDIRVYLLLEERDY